MATVTFRWAAVGGGKLSPCARRLEAPASPGRARGAPRAAGPRGRPSPRRRPAMLHGLHAGGPGCVRVPKSLCARSPDPRVCACPPDPCAVFPRSTAASAGIAQRCSAPRCVFLSRLYLRQPGLPYTWIIAARWTRW